MKVLSRAFLVSTMESTQVRFAVINPALAFSALLATADARTKMSFGYIFPPVVEMV